MHRELNSIRRELQKLQGQDKNVESIMEKLIMFDRVDQMLQVIEEARASKVCRSDKHKAATLMVPTVGKWFNKPCLRTILRLKFDWDPMC